MLRASERVRQCNCSKAESAPVARIRSVVVASWETHSNPARPHPCHSLSGVSIVDNWTGVSGVHRPVPAPAHAAAVARHLA